jgi:hypothetical protein
MAVLRRSETLPESGMMLPAMISKRVVFPVPFRPMTAMRSLMPTVKLTPLKSSWSLYDLEMSVTLSMYASYHYHYSAKSRVSESED